MDSHVTAMMYNTFHMEVYIHFWEWLWILGALCSELPLQLWMFSSAKASGTCKYSVNPANGGTCTHKPDMENMLFMNRLFGRQL